jgi:hypothetical protein
VRQTMLTTSPMLCPGLPHTCRVVSRRLVAYRTNATLFTFTGNGSFGSQSLSRSGLMYAKRDRACAMLEVILPSDARSIVGRFATSRALFHLRKMTLVLLHCLWDLVYVRRGPSPASSVGGISICKGYRSTFYRKQSASAIRNVSLTFSDPKPKSHPNWRDIVREYNVW